MARNAYARRFASTCRVDAFIDDSAVERTFLGKPVLRRTELPAGALVVSCVVDGRPITALQRLAAVGAEAVDYFALVRVDSQRFGPLQFCEGNRKDILEHESDYDWVYARLADARSREIFAAVVQFRLTLDLQYMRGFSLATDRQYFEDFVPLPPGGVFVDGGGYDGQTSATFAQRSPAYRSIHLFEPVPANLDLARRNLSGLRDVHCEAAALGAVRGRARFDPTLGPASHIAPAGTAEVDIVTLDERVSERVTLAKFDIEGAELEALLGATRHIQEDRPSLAVCVYHAQHDFWRIPRHLLGIYPDYQVYVRHYSEGILETVMFFIPRS